MSEIQILIPLAVFGDAENLSPQALTEAISKAADAKQLINQLEATNDGLIKQIRSGGSHLEEIWELSDSMDKAQKMRKLIADMKGFGK